VPLGKYALVQYAGNQNTTTLLAVEHDVLAVLLAAQSETNVRIRSTGIGVHLQTGMVFGITTESRSESQRNGVRLQNGITFAFDRIPYLGTASPILHSRKVK